jgi:hypothetical protein
MIRHQILRCFASLGVFCLTTTGFAITIDFEGLTDSTAVGGTYSASGVTFIGATVLTSGISLNELEFPPRSGDNVVFDDGGPLRGVFSAPMGKISAYMTYAHRVTLYAYDAFGSPIGSISTAFADNTVSSGRSPNELLTLTAAGGIMSFSFEGDPSGDSFTLDDFSFEPASPGPSVPDTGSCLALLAISLIGLRFVSYRFARGR